MSEKVTAGDIIKALANGVKVSEVKELLELANKEPAQVEEPKQEEPKQDEPKQDEPAKVEEKEEPKQEEPEEKDVEIERLKHELAEAQKKNAQMDVSGATNTKSDQDIFADIVRSFM